MIHKSWSRVETLQVKVVCMVFSRCKNMWVPSTALAHCGNSHLFRNPIHNFPNAIPLWYSDVSVAKCSDNCLTDFVSNCTDTGKTYSKLVTDCPVFNIRPKSP